MRISDWSSDVCSSDLTYTSPHLVRFNERIRLAGKLIGDEKLVALLERCERVNAGRPITFFEITTAAAFLAFDLAAVKDKAITPEEGLGGPADTAVGDFAGDRKSVVQG